MRYQMSERRIRNNKLRRRRQLRRHIAVCLMTLFLAAGFSVLFFGFKSKAQSIPEEVSYKYYKSVTIKSGDTIWDYAEHFADAGYYDSYNSYIEEVRKINALQDDSIQIGQHIILPYYSNEFRE